MERQELITSTEYLSTSIALSLWGYDGRNEANYEYWEKVAENITNDICVRIIKEVLSGKDSEIERLNKGIRDIIERDKDKPTSDSINILKMLHNPIGEFICQRDIEGESKCDKTCDHCQEYYKPLIEDRK